MPEGTGLKFEQRGSTWTTTDGKWPFLLIARHVYIGTDRVLSTLTLVRTDVGSKGIVILTSRVDLLTASRRREFSKEAGRRLKPTVEASEESIEISVGAMLDGLLERLQQAQDSIEIFSAADIEIPKDLTPPYALWPLIPASRPGMLVAPSGTGKSSLAQLIGLSVVTGSTILERLVPRRQGPVLYVGQEEDKEQWAARLEMICRGHKLERPRHYFYLRLTGASLIDSAPLLAETAASRKAALVIVDSAQATWGSEGDSGVRGYATQWFNAVAEIGVPVLVIEHPNLANTMKGNASAASGAGVKQDRVGHQWGMKSVALPVRPGFPLRYHVTLVDAKRNYVARQPDITYETQVHGFEWMRFVESDELTAATIVEGSRVDDALAAITREPDELHDEGWLVSELVARLKLKDDKSVRNALKADHWRPAHWSEGLTYRWEQVEGSGTNNVNNPAKYLLVTQEPSDAVQVSMPPGDPEFTA